MLYRAFHSTRQLLKRKDHYEALNVKRHADKNTIKKQYYRLSKQYHPDLNPNNAAAHAKFLEINEAYAVLGNEATRREYDREADDRPMAATTTSNWYTSTAHFRSGPSASWHGRSRHHSKNTGSASARAQAEGMGKNNTSSSFYREHFTRYQAEEARRRHRMQQAAKRRREAGLETEPDADAYRQIESWWSRMWRLAIVLGGIGYATHTLHQNRDSIQHKKTS